VNDHNTAANNMTGILLKVAGQMVNHRPSLLALIQGKNLALIQT
jgi:hypothetical protein